MLSNKSFFNILVCFIIAGTLFSINVTNSHAQLASLPDYERSYGPISSINNDWILTGGYMGYGNPSNVSDSGFHATFSMVLKNGTAYHMHQISNATLEDVKMEGNNTIMQGSVTVTMKDGPVSNVPTTWTISDNNTLAISMDPSKINDHFGNTPIYGIVQTPEKEMDFTNLMSQDSKFMDKWIPLMMQNTLSSIKLEGGNITSMPNSNTSMDNNISSIIEIGNISSPMPQ